MKKPCVCFLFTLPCQASEIDQVASNMVHETICLNLMVYWFLFCQGVRFFLCPTFVTCWLFHFHITFTELKIYHLSFFHHTVQQWHCWSWQYAGCMSNMNLVYGLALSEFLCSFFHRSHCLCRWALQVSIFFEQPINIVESFAFSPG